MRELSVIICTYNPRPDYLRRVLEALRAQTLPLDQWELIVVDNASDRLLSEEWNLLWHPAARHVREDELGLAYARQRGMCEAAADLLVFVDDDNVLAPDYLAEALRIGREWPQLGVWGGSIVPEFEVEPPVRLQRYLRYLALREVSSARWSNVATCSEAEPWGAGMCVRSSVASVYRQHYLLADVQLTDRTGKNLVSGGDTEICYVACGAGFGMGLFPELRITHLIPKERIEARYLLRLAQGMALSNALLSFKWRGEVPDSPFSTIGLLRIFRAVATKRGMVLRMHLAGLRGMTIATAAIRGYRSASLGVARRKETEDSLSLRDSRTDDLVINRIGRLSNAATPSRPAPVDRRWPD